MNESPIIGHEPIVLRILNSLRPWRWPTFAAFVLALVMCDRAASAEPAGDGTVVVLVADDPQLPADDVRLAIASELKMRVHEAGAEASVGTVEVTIADGSLGAPRMATVRFRGLDGRSVARTIELPPEPTRAIEAIALLAGNLVRDEAGALIAMFARDEEVPAAVAEPVPAPVAEPVAAPELEDEKVKPVVEAGWEKTKPAEASSDEGRWSLQDSVTVHLSLFHPVSLRRDAENIAADVELGLAYSRIGRVGAVGFNVFVLRIDDDLTGFGFGSLVVSAGGDLDGFMFAGLVSHVDGSIQGGQVGSLVVGGAVEGVQLGGVSVAGDVDGVQLGLVNVAGKVRGMQLGVVNVAEDVEGMSLGLVSVGGRIQPTVWTTTTTPVNAGVMFRARPGYTLLHGGWDPDGDHQQLGAALGVGWPVGSFFFDGDMGYAGEWDGDLFGEVDRHVIRYRLTAGIRPVEWISFFAGGGVRHDVELGPTSEVRPEFHAGVQAF